MLSNLETDFDSILVLIWSKITKAAEKVIFQKQWCKISPVGKVLWFEDFLPST